MHLLMSENYSMYTGDEIMTGEKKTSAPPTDYVPPQVLKMGSMRIGSGSPEDCEPMGSTANGAKGEDCRNGGTAFDKCKLFGSTAGYKCDTGSHPG
jgi:hypothetical protein